MQWAQATTILPRWDPIFDELRQWALDVAPSASVRVGGLWHIDCVYQPTGIERKFVYGILVAQSRGQGACYYAPPRVDPRELEARVGSQFEIQAARPQDPIDFALLDSVAAGALCTPAARFTLKGDSRDKAHARAAVIATEASRLARAPGRRPRICVVGLVGLLVQELQALGCEVTCTDMDPRVVGRMLPSGVFVDDASRTLDRVAEADVAVITGMTLANSTFAGVHARAETAGTELVMFCETGSGFAPFLIELGVASVVAEPFPFYIFDGTTEIRVYRR